MEELMMLIFLIRRQFFFSHARCNSYMGHPNS